MKRYRVLITILLISMLALPSWAQCVTSVSDKAPDALKQLFKEYQEKGKDAAAAATLLVRAMYYASTVPTIDEARQYVAIFLETKELDETPGAFTGFDFTTTTANYIMYMREDSRVIASYFKGTKVDDDYKLPGPVETLEANIVGDIRYKDDSATKKIVDPQEVAFMNVQSNGKEQPTWLRLRKNRDGYYKVDYGQGISSFATGVQKPQ